MAMNPKLMAMMKAKRTPKAESPAAPVASAPDKTADYHNEQVRRHLQKGLDSPRRSAKVHLKLAKYHHDCACGRNHGDAA